MSTNFKGNGVNLCFNVRAQGRYGNVMVINLCLEIEIVVCPMDLHEVYYCLAGYSAEVDSTISQDKS